jgi:hypothetical protein
MCHGVHVSARKLSVRKKARGNPAWVKGHNQAGPGRPKGSQDKYTREIKQALLDAVEYVGEETVATALKELPEPERDKAEHDLNTPRGVTAFLVWIAREYPQVACAMLARMMPQQTESTHKVEHTYHSLEEIGNRLRELGLPAQRIYPLLFLRIGNLRAGKMFSRFVIGF